MSFQSRFLSMPQVTAAYKREEYTIHLMRGVTQDKQSAILAKTTCLDMRKTTTTTIPTKLSSCTGYHKIELQTGSCRPFRRLLTACSVAELCPGRRRAGWGRPAANAPGTRSEEAHPATCTWANRAGWGL